MSNEGILSILLLKTTFRNLQPPISAMGKSQGCFWILKYRSFPLAEIPTVILEIGRKWMGCPAEIEFAVNLGLEISGPLARHTGELE